MISIIETARELYEADQEAWAEIYRKAKDDLHFLSDEMYAQWDERDYERRVKTGRPALTIDQLGQFIHQTANDVRMNTPTIHVIPAGYESDNDTAEILKGLIRNIEYRSHADSAYDTAVTAAIKGSIGFIRVDHDYVDDKSFDQELFIRRVINPFSVLIDGASVEVDGSDAMHGHIIEDMSVRAFKARYPTFDPVSFHDAGGKALQKEEDEIAICEFFQIEEHEEALHAAQDSQQQRIIKKRTVKRYTLSGQDILEETVFPGQYIPIVPVYGEESWQDGKRQLCSLIRKSKDAQRMFNYWKSLETEILMKQPQAPVMVAEGQIEDYAEDWQDPQKSMALRYKTRDDDGTPLPAPIRLAPPPVPTGVINAAKGAVDDIKATMGIYNAALGARSNETSGIAINQRKLEGDMATYHFGDNLVKSITHVGRILVCAIPEIYDTERIIRIIDEEENPKSVGINGMRTADQEDSYNLTGAQYDVRVVTGAPFTTRRQEAAQFFENIATRQPDLMTVMGDLLFKYQDFSGAEAMAERMKKVIDPSFLDDEQEIDPEKQQMMQLIEEGKQQIEVLQEQLADKSAHEEAKLKVDIFKIQSDAQLKMKELEIREREIRGLDE